MLNTADVAVDLTDWQIKDKQKNMQLLSGSIAAGATTVVEIKAPVALSNKGGIITLLNAQGREGARRVLHQGAGTPARADHPVPELTSRRPTDSPAVISLATASAR